MSARRPRIAYFSPLPPDRSGIADYSAELLPHLARVMEVDCFVHDCLPAREILDAHEVIDTSVTDPVPLLSDYDAVLYQLGNSPSHRSIYETLMRWPGLVVMHEVALPHLVVPELLRDADRGRYLREMRALHGDEGAERARHALYGDEEAPWESDAVRFPMNRRALGQATGVLAHSRVVAEGCRVFPGLHVEQLDHHAFPVPTGVTAAQRPPGADLLAVIAGHLTPAKRIPQALAALSALRRPDGPAFHLRLVGKLLEQLQIPARAQALGVADRVEIRGRVSKRDLYAELLAADVCICLRHPTLGETSGIAMRALACGLPLITSDAGWFSELPDEVAIKIPAGDQIERRALAAALERLAREPGLRARMREAARAYAAERSPQSRAAGYRDFILRAGLFPSRFAGRAYLRAVERFRSLDLPHPTTAARQTSARVSDLLAWRDERVAPATRERVPREFGGN